IAPPGTVATNVSQEVYFVQRTDKEEIEKLKKDLEEANKKIAALDKKVTDLSELLYGKSVFPRDPGALEQLDLMKKRVAALESELGTLKTQTVQKPAVVQDTKPKGVVKVVNEYPVEISMLINDRTYRVAPNTKIEVEVPAGEFTYQLLQSGQPATRSVIKDKEPVTLRIK
ncbi:MAG: hypothetical protein K2V38_21625, partial [Gemmataceae bacterium]|nr:hypothetical protein [Gemmataceae bacterium]